MGKVTSKSTVLFLMKLLFRFLFDPYNVKDVFFKRNGSLFFSIVDDSHSGKYTCTPFNALGTEGQVYRKKNV